MQHHQTGRHMGTAKGTTWTVPFGEAQRRNFVEANRILRYESPEQLAVTAAQIGLQAMLNAHKKAKGE